MITRKVATDGGSCVEQASEALRELVASGVSHACEAVVERYPQLQSDVDGMLEVIYLESVLRQDQDPNLTVSELTAEYTQRFPDFRQDIVKLLEVNRAFSSLGLHASSSSGNLSAGQATASVWEHSIGMIGEYQLLELLGQGGMGVVYRAIQTRLGRVVAIKTISADHADGATIGRFQKEAELASSLQHPNIVQIHEVGVQDELPFYSMEYVAGGSLAEFLKDHPLRADRAAQLVAILARAADFAHSHGIVHRDLKPANILLSPSVRPEALKLLDSRNSLESKQTDETYERFEPKIVDFGLAIQLAGAESVVPRSRAAGTPSYMAPEQIDTSIGPSTAVTDVYALGSILYHALVGRPPFYAATTQETLRQVQEDEPISPRKLQPKISADLETICLKALRKVPAARYASAAELADDLQRYLDGKPILARPASYLELAYKWAVRNPSLAGLIVAMLLAIVSTTWLWRQSADSLAAELVERQRNEQLNYDRNIALAHLEYESHNVDRALEILEGCDPKYRNFEWNYVHQICHEPAWECKSGNSDRLSSAALSPDGRLVATGHGYWGDDIPQTVYVWDVSQNKVLWSLQGHPNCEISAVDFHPTGKRLLSCGMAWRNRDFKGGIREWNLETGQLIRVIADKNVRSACYSADGSRIFVGEADGNVSIYDADSGQLMFDCRRHKQLVLSMCESSNGQLLATSGRDGTLAVWDIMTGRELTSLKDMGDPREVTWTPDMSRLMVAGFGGRIDTFRWRDNSLHLESTSSESFTRLSRYSPDGLRLVTGVPGEGVIMRDAHDGRLIRVFHGHRAQIDSIDFDRTGRWLLTAGTDGSCRVWDTMREYGFSHMAYLSVGNAEAIVNRPNTSHFAVALGAQPSKPRLASRGGDIEVYDAITQRIVHTFLLRQSADGSGDFPTTLSYSPSGQRFCSGSLNRRIFVWDWNMRDPLAVLSGHQAQLCYVCMTDDDQTISVDADGQLKIWNIPQGQAVEEWSLVASLSSTSPPKIHAATIDLKKQWVALATDAELSIVHLRTRQVLCKQPLRSRVNQLVISPDSQRLGVATAASQTLLYQLKESSGGLELTEPLSLKGHHEGVTGLSFSPDSRRLASVGRDEALRLYELELGNEILKLEEGSLTDGVVAFSLDGQQLIRVAGHQIYTYSLQRLDPNAALTDQQALEKWHNDNYRTAYRTLQTLGTKFHSRRLVELQPDNVQFQLNLAGALIDEGKFEQAEQTLLPLESPVLRLRFARLASLVRLALQRRDFEIYRQRMFELEDTVRQIDQPDYWNDLVWYGSLTPTPPIELAGPVAKLEVVAAQKRSGSYRNTLALAYYRLGKLSKAIPMATESMQAPISPTPPPIDYLIKALCQIPFLERSKPAPTSEPGAAMSTKEADKAQSFNVRAQGLQILLGHIEDNMSQSNQRRFTPTKMSRSEMMMFQLEIPLLLEELKRGMDRCGLSHPVVEPIAPAVSTRLKAPSPAHWATPAARRDILQNITFELARAGSSSTASR